MTDDHPSVQDVTDLYRRVHPTQIVWDENDCCLRPTTAVFRDIEMSVHISDVLETEGRTPASVLETRPHHQLIAVTTGFARSQEQVVTRNPLSDDSSHGNVVGMKPKSRRRQFVRHAKWEVLRTDKVSTDLQAKLGEVQAT